MTAFDSLLRPELAGLASYVPAHPPGIRVRLDANEAPALPAAAKEAAARAMANVALARYPDARATALKEAIARRRNVTPDEILIGTGSDEVIALLATALARPRGKNPQPVVLTATPTFVMYKTTARAHGWKPVEVALDAAWDLDVRSMTRAIEMMTPSVVYVASPNNPTGNAMSADRIDALAAACAAAGTLFVLDEAYADYARSPAGARRPGTAVLRTLSKVGLAALRVGWIEADADLIAEIDKVRQPFNVSATSQAAARAVLDEAWGAVEEMVREIVAERGRVAAAITGATPSDANFSWVRTEKPAGEVHAALAARGVLVRSFHAAGGRLANQLRVTVGSRAENDAFLEAWHQCV